MKKLRHFLTFALIPTFILLVYNIKIETGKMEPSGINQKEIQSTLYFEQNMGQLNEEVQYVLKGTNHSVFLMDNELLLTVKDATKPLKDLKKVSGNTGFSINPVRSQWFTMQFPGSNKGNNTEGLEKLASKSNYLTGNDPDKWRSNIPHYGKVAYLDIYPGIDLVCYGNENSLEYDFIVASGADPQQISIEFEGVEDITIDEGGNLNLRIGSKTVYHKKPIAYQQIENNKKIIESDYNLNENGLVSFELGDYNAEYAIVIDPIISYSTYIGGLANDQGHDIVTDKQGNVFISGMTGFDFPITSGAYDEIFGPDEQNQFDLYPVPNALEFTYNSGEYSVLPGNSAIDPVVGPAVSFTGNPPYPYDDDYAEVVLPFQFSFQNQSYNSIFVNSDGNITFGQPHAFSNRMRHDMIFGPPRVAAFYSDLAPIVFGFGNVHADVRADRVVVTWVDVPAFSGDYSSLSSPLTFQIILHANGDIQIIYDFIEAGFGAIVGTSAGNNPEDRQEIDLSEADGSEEGGTLFEVFNYGSYVFADAYIMKFNKDNELVWSTYLGGDFVDQARGISLDKNGDIITQLITLSSDLPVFGSLNRNYSGGYFQWDGYVAKLSKNGDVLHFGSYIGGSGTEMATNVVVDQKNNLYFSGVTTSTDFLDGESTEYDGAFSNQGGIQPYIVKLKNDGSLITYTHFPANGINRYGYQRRGIRVTPNGKVILAGNDNSGNVPTTPGVFQPANAGGYDVFVAQFSSDLKSLEAATYLGGSGDEIDSEFALDRSGNIYISAMTSSLDFPVTDKAFDKTYNGGSTDGFLTKIDAGLKKLVYSTYYGGSNSDEPEAIEVDPSGEVFVAGLTRSYDFPVTESTIGDPIPAGAAYLMKFDKKGKKLKYSTIFGGSGEDLPFGVSITPGGKDHQYDYNKNDKNKTLTLNLTGLTKSPEFPTTPDAFDTTYGNIDGWNDVIFMRFLFGHDDDDYHIAELNDPVSVKATLLSAPPTSKYYEGKTKDDLVSVSLEELMQRKEAFTANMNIDDWRQEQEKSSSENFLSTQNILHQNYPNPFSQKTNIGFQLGNTSHVLVRVLALDGKEIIRIADNVLKEGSHRFIWDGKDAFGNLVPDGIYLLQMKNGNHAEVKRMMLLK